MSRARTVGLTVAIFLVASLILAIALTQPASHGPAGQLPAIPKSLTAMESRVRDLKEVNYYPAAGGWTYMWSHFDPTAIDRDFARIRALDANTVRIIIQPSVFGFPTVRPVMADRLSEVIGLAAKHSLRVHLTLFDWWSQFSDIDGSKEWVSSLLSRYRDDPRIAVVELQNEIYPTESCGGGLGDHDASVPVHCPARNVADGVLPGACLLRFSPCSSMSSGVRRRTSGITTTTVRQKMPTPC